jgi:diaminopimelate epimerase
MNFWKMHGLGNDYIVIDNRESKISDLELGPLAKKLCAWHFSIGADGLLLLSISKAADVRMRIFNPDGSEAEMCGNGIRCLAKFAYEFGVIKKDEFTVETEAGLKQVRLVLEKETVKEVRVDMGIPNWKRSALPMNGDGECINEDLQVDDETYKVTCLSIGNPHCVVFVENVDEFPVEYVGGLIENNQEFPNRTNVEFVQVVSKNVIKVRVWERGVGETLSCGTGACAAAVAANRLRYVSPRLRVHLLGGELHVEVTQRVFLVGPAEKVFEGKLFK